MVARVSAVEAGVRRVDPAQGRHWIELAYDSMADWPLHPLGRAVDSSVGLPITRSWSMTEWVPDNVKSLIDDQDAAVTFPNRRQVTSVVVGGELVAADGAAP